MKTLKTLSIIAVLIASLGLTSCIDDGDSRNYLAGHVTIEGTYPNYTLYHRQGYIIKLTPSSVSELTGGKGFGTNKRGFFNVSFRDEDVKYNYIEGTEKLRDITIENAELISGSYVSTLNIMAHETAESKNLLAADSIFAINRYEDFWIDHGYLNIVVEAPYSIIDGGYVYPTMNVIYKEEDIKENAITLTMLYNRHTSKDAKKSIGSFITAYPIKNLISAVPGNDSITVTVRTDGADRQVTKMAR